ncbi:MAG: hypothetical protein NXI22_10000 [bacterium]|nr:hypothetical protein [bacterium]
MILRMTASALFAATLLVFPIASFSIASAAEKKNEVKELMIAAHKAPKGKTSPLQKLQAEFKKDAPNWETIGANTKPLAKLAAVIKDKSFGYRGPTKPYVDAVAKLKTASSDNDIIKGRAAIAAISQSCASCHR